MSESPGGEVALITGAGSGIGATTAARLADMAGPVGLVLNDRDGAALVADGGYTL